jgi:predicted DNA-binding transcriptional regulator AlpA
MRIPDPSTNTQPMGVKERIGSFGRALEAKELAAIFGVTEALIYKQARKGIIPSFRIGTLVRFDPRAVCDWFDRQ